uniref:Uncharacterized protein n=1 Tax=Bracon brevicornis TaxID=1563983 RepID=A0A6V7LDY9_9HYME
MLSNVKNRSDKKWQRFKNLSEATIHYMCYRAYSNEAYPDSDASYNFKENCFFCDLALDKVHKEVHVVSSDAVRIKLLRKAGEIDDAWSKTVRDRIEGVASLTAANASYHRKCYNKFLRRKEPLDENPGRPNPQKAIKRKRNTESDGLNIEQNLRLIKMAAKIIKSDIRNKMPDLLALLTQQQDMLEQIPETLRTFVDLVMSKKSVDQNSFENKSRVILSILEANFPADDGDVEDDEEPTDEPIGTVRTRSKRQKAGDPTLG